MYEKSLVLAIRAAICAGRRILEIYNDATEGLQVEYKSDCSPLTIADKEAHRLIVTMLSESEYPLLSEESQPADYAGRSEWDRFWMVDPLDGTKEFIRRNGEFTVNIALVQEGVPVVGVIYVPVTRMLYFAAESVGAYRCEVASACDRFLSLAEWLQYAGRQLPCVSHEGTVVVASRSHLSPETSRYIEKVRAFVSDLTMISSGSSLKLCRVAEGSADLYPRFAPTMEWDTAAGHAILRMSGCELYDASTGTPLQYNKEDLHNPWFVACVQHSELYLQS